MPKDNRHIIRPRTSQEQLSTATLENIRPPWLKRPWDKGRKRTRLQRHCSRERERTTIRMKHQKHGCYFFLDLLLSEYTSIASGNHWLEFWWKTNTGFKISGNHGVLSNTSNIWAPSASILYHCY